MHIVIMGCGRVGSTLALGLQGLGHDITVIDQNPDSFRRLGDTFGGSTVTGLGFDRATLREAGIERAEAYAAVSSGDNSNILGARVARETFGVENVVARIYDPGRAEVYQRLGIPTVATVPWAADQVLRRLLPQGSVAQFRDPSGGVVLLEVGVHRAWVGTRLVDLDQRLEVRVAYVTRFGRATLPTPDTVYQEGDLLHVLVQTGRVVTVAAALAAPPQQEG